MMTVALTTLSIGRFASRKGGFHCWGCEDIRPGDRRE
jgi:hypothetical protein